jgi:arylsulfatase A-like enzyme
MKSLLTVSLLALACVAQAAIRPNILFCFADDWGRYASCYAKVDGRPGLNDIVKTPNIDSVTRRGVMFRHAFVGSPSCTPCRSALVSGRYFFQTGQGAILNGAVWDAKIPSWPLLLKDSGYHIGKAYKVWSPGTPADAPYGGQKFAYEKAGRLYNNFSENVTKMVAEGTPLAQAKEKLLAQVRENLAAFLADRKPGEPFCFWFGPTLTHRKWQKGSGKALWGIEPDSLKGKLPRFMPDVPEIREDVADYLGECQAWDAGVGVLLKKLEEAGELANTLVVISGDHGMPGVPGGKCNLYDFGTAVALVAAGPGVNGPRVVDDFVWLPDLAATFLEAGGVKKPEGMVARSILPLLASTKSGQIDPERSWVITGRERHVGAAREGNLPYPHRALRTKDFLYIRNFKPDRTPMGDARGVTATATPATTALENDTYTAFADMDASPTKAWLIEHRNDPQWKWIYDYAFAKRPAEELYDLRGDPDEVKNVAGESAYAEAKEKLAAQLLRTLREHRDPRVEGDAFDHPPFAGDAGVPARQQRAAPKPAGSR